MPDENRIVYSGLYSNDGRTLRAERALDTGDIEIIDNHDGQVKLRMTLLAAENLAEELRRAAKLGRDIAERT